MKRLFTLALAISAIIGAFAAAPIAERYAKPITNSQAFTSQLSGKSLNPEKAVVPANIPQSRGAEDVGAIVNPAGRPVMYQRDCTRFQAFAGLQYSYGLYSGKMVWGDDNTVYIQDIISGLPSGLYVEGTVEGNKITVQLPQPCYVESDEGEDLVFFATKMKYYEYDKNGETYIGYRNVADDDNFVTYNINEDGTISLDLNDGDPNDLRVAPTYLVGLVIDPSEGIDDWWGFGDSYQTYYALEEEAVTLPDDIELETWAMLSEESGNRTVQVGFYGNDVYFANVGDYGLEGLTFKGTLEGDKIKVESGQFLGSFVGYLTYLMLVQWTDDNYDDYLELDEIYMTYDAENKIIAVNNPLVDFVFNAGLDELLPLDYLTDPTFVYQSEEDTNAAPEAPYVEYFDEYAFREYYDTYEGYIEWIIPSVNVNGFMLDPERMYYNFLVNGEVKTFTIDEYPLFEEEVTDIPYFFGDDFDLQVFDTSHYFTFKSADYKTFGLQSFYVGTDDVVYASELVTYVPETNGIENITAKKAVKEVQFYNLQGQKVANPTNGIYLMRSTFDDGTSSVTKISKK